MKSVLRNLSLFDTLTAAEAAVIEDAAETKTYEAGSEIPIADRIVIIAEGRVRLDVSGAETRELGTLARGSLLGEMNLFEPEPAPLSAHAAESATCLVWKHEAIKNTFRYSRTGAAKMMAVFSRSLSHKIRLANELLQAAPASASGGARQPRELDALDLSRLRSFSISRDYAEGVSLFKEGDPGEELFVIYEGEVEILKQTSSGEPMSLAKLQTGDFFGEMAFVDQSPRSASAVAATPLRVNIIASATLDLIFQYNVGLALSFTNVLAKIMSRRLDVTVRRVAEL